MEFKYKEIFDYINDDEILKSNFKDEKIPNLEIIDKMKKLMEYGKIVCISETWCKDCKRDVPKLGKMAEFLPKWEFLVLKRDDESVKSTFSVTAIPTTIIYDTQNNELGRIIENKKYTCLEEDILRIIKKSY